MALNKLKDKLNESDNYHSKTEATAEARYERVFLVVQDFGYKTDSEGKPVQYVTGQLLDPREQNSNNNPDHARVYFKSAEQSAKIRSSIQSGNGRSGSYEQHLADQRRIYSRRHTMAEHLAGQNPDENGSMVMAFDFAKIEDTHTVVHDGVKSKVYDMAAHWGSVISKQYGPDDDREHKVVMGLGRLGFQPHHNTTTGRDIVYAEMLEEQKSFRLKAQSDPSFKESQASILHFLKKGFDNKEKPGDSARPDTAFRTGFVAVKVGLHGEDGLKDLPDTTMKFYPSRKKKEDSGSIDRVTGEYRTISEPDKPLQTLTDLMTLQDKATLDYQTTPENPDLERRAKEADNMRGVMHAVSGRDHDKHPLALAVTNDQEHLNRVQQFNNAAMAGDLQITMTAGRKYDLFADIRDRKADITRVVYDTKFPNNPSKSTTDTKAKPHSSDHSMMQVTTHKDPKTGETRRILDEVYAPMAFSLASITDPAKTSSPGTMLGRMIKTVQPNNIMAGDFTRLKTADANLINQYQQNYRLGHGIEGLEQNPGVDNFFKANPIHKSIDAAIKWHKEYGHKAIVTEGTLDTRKTVIPRTLEGKDVYDTSELGAGLSELMADKPTLASDNNIDDTIAKNLQSIQDGSKRSNQLLEALNNMEPQSNAAADEALENALAQAAKNAQKEEPEQAPTATRRKKM
ncbi:hypothetical protein [Psychrobacter sp. AOP31-A1-22]|uniref:hypothetical protein n=1 Tax=Psychrobacter sp. AOP31-A1-22 TaxID=3457696 RepID=UPI0040375055